MRAAVKKQTAQRIWNYRRISTYETASERIIRHDNKMCKNGFIFNIKYRILTEGGNLRTKFIEKQGDYVKIINYV
jgi:hypothetical protein